MISLHSIAFFNKQRWTQRINLTLNIVNNSFALTQEVFVYADFDQMNLHNPLFYLLYSSSRYLYMCCDLVRSNWTKMLKASSTSSFGLHYSRPAILWHVFICICADASVSTMPPRVLLYYLSTFVIKHNLSPETSWQSSKKIPRTDSFLTVLK